MINKVKTSITYILKAIHIVYKSSPKWTIVNSLITIIRGTIPLLLLVVVKQLIDVVDEYISAEIVDQSKLYYTIALTGTFFLLNSITGSINSLCRERQAHFVNDYIQNIIHDKTVNIPYRYFEDPNYQDIFFRALSDATFRPGRVFYGLLQVIQSLVTLCLILVVLSGLNWLLTPILLISSIPIIYFRIKHSKRIYNYRKEHTEDERRVHYFNRLLTAKDFAKELRIFDLSATFKQEYEHYKHDLRSKQWSLAKSKTAWELSLQLFSTSILIVIIVFVIDEAIEGHISNGTMAMYFLALQRGYGVLQSFLASITSLYEDNLFLKNFFEFQKIDASKGAPTNNFPSLENNSISINNLSFKYPNTDKWVLNNINLTIPCGKTIALVGKNGCGKTTLVKLLSGLYKANKGNISINNTNWSDISPEEFASNISVIFQDFMLYNVSANENIRFGNVKRNAPDDAIVNAAEKAGINHLFSNLTNGYESTLGTLFKGSHMLSRGEWQRTALARSFYNTNAQLIILDEPTSSLDAFTESNLITHFKEITKDKTSIIVSHRLSTIKLADIIVVLQDSGIAETGSEEELLQKKGVYYNMIQSLK